MSINNNFIWVAVFAIAAAIVNTLGILTIFKYRAWAQKVKVYLMCFAAGVLASTPLILALPQAVKKTPWAGFVALGGFLFMFFHSSSHNTHRSFLSLSFYKQAR